ncbi:MAG: CHASE domain-containing protein [Rhodospirillales bacterium]
MELASASRSFRDRADSLQRDLAHRFGGTEAVLTALVGLHHASDSVKSYELSALSNELLRSYPHIRTIALMRVLPAEERERFEEDMRADGFMTFKVTERGPDNALRRAADRSRTLPIRVFEPLDPQFAALIGFDVLSEPILAQAIDRAVRSGAVVASDPLDIPLIGRGIVVFKAIYLGHNSPRTKEGRETQLAGVIALVLEPKQFFRSFVDSYGDLDFSLTAAPELELGAETPVFEHRQTLPDGVLRSVAPFTSDVVVAANSRSYVLHVQEYHTLSTIRPWYVALFVALGLVVSGLLVLALIHRRIGRLQAHEGERILRQNQERFRDYAEIASDWFWSTDAELRFDYFSKRFASSEEFRPLTLRGERGGEHAKFEPHGVDGERYFAELQARRPFKDVLYEYADHAGNSQWWRMSGKPVLDENGAFIGYRGTGRNVTDEVEVQQSLRMAKEQAELANRAKSEFIANVSHELRTPLNAVIGFSEVMISETLGPLGNRKYAEYAQDIHESGQHLLALINDILDLSKVESGSEELYEEDIHVPDMAKSLMTLMRHHAEKGKVVLLMELDQTLPKVAADKRKLKQILVNLLSNAVKFTKPGGNVILRGWIDEEGGFVFQVADTGIGMAPDDIPKALQKFRQVDSDLNRKYEGTGLGLPLAKALAELHGGSLVMESELGRGTTVTVRLPPDRVMLVAPRGAAVLRAS